MRAAWAWLSLRLPFVVQTRRGHWQDGLNAFTLGRDFERGLRGDAK